jgi:hypothetical protein
MGMMEDAVSAIKATNVRRSALQAISLGMIVMSALIIWKRLMCFTGSESPVVVVLTGSMEPGFRRVPFFSPFFSHRIFLCSLGFCLKDFSIRLDLQSILLYFAGEQGTF